MKEGVTVWLVRNFENKLDIWKFAIRIYFSGVGALSTIRSVNARNQVKVAIKMKQSRAGIYGRGGYQNIGIRNHDPFASKREGKARRHHSNIVSPN